MRYVVWIVFVAFIILFAQESKAEARCGRAGLFRGRQPVRTLLHNRPHLFHRNCK